MHGSFPSYVVLSKLKTYIIGLKKALTHKGGNM